MKLCFYDFYKLNKLKITKIILGSNNNLTLYKKKKKVFFEIKALLPL